MRDKYIRTIDQVISFLQEKNTTLAYFICERNYLPEASRFTQAEDLDWAFGTMGIRDKAKHLATLYLEDLSDLIIEALILIFGFSRYAERLAVLPILLTSLTTHFWLQTLLSMTFFLI